MAVLVRKTNGRSLNWSPNIRSRFNLSLDIGGRTLRLDSFYGTPRPNSGEEGLDVLARGNGRWEWLVPIDLLKLDDEGAVVTVIQ